MESGPSTRAGRTARERRFRPFGDRRKICQIRIAELCFNFRRRDSLSPNGHPLALLRRRYRVNLVEHLQHDGVAVGRPSSEIVRLVHIISVTSLTGS
jgi:hypothetical protein